MWMNLSDNSLIEVNDIHPVDISLDPVSGEIFAITSNRSLVSINSNSIQVIFNFDEVPVALDVFEVFAYVLLNSGVVSQIRTQGYTSGNLYNFLGIQNYNIAVTIAEEEQPTNRPIGNITTATDIKILHPLKQLNPPRKLISYYILV